MEFENSHPSAGARRVEQVHRRTLGKAGPEPKQTVQLGVELKHVG